MFTVADSVANKGGAAATLYPYGVVERQGIQSDEASLYLHVGFVGVANGSEVDAKYDDFKDAATPAKNFSSTGGWVGITDKYWMAAIIPPQDQLYSGAYLGSGSPLPREIPSPEEYWNMRNDPQRPIVYPPGIQLAGGHASSAGTTDPRGVSSSPEPADATSRDTVSGPRPRSSRTSRSMPSTAVPSTTSESSSALESSAESAQDVRHTTHTRDGIPIDTLLAAGIRETPEDKLAAAN